MGTEVGDGEISTYKFLRFEEITEYFGELEAACSSINLLRPLIKIVMIALMATLAVTAGPIATWAQLKQDLLLNASTCQTGSRARTFSDSVETGSVSSLRCRLDRFPV